MEDILLLHRSSKSNLDLPHPVWRTCLRQIAFLNRASEQSLPLHALQADDRLLRGEEAISFLIEVLCGLHSPVVGETEVFGQFRTFAEEQERAGSHGFHKGAKWIRFVYQEVKELRSLHMRDLGAHSYGSLLRKRCKSASTLSICGSGQLTREILPWLAKDKAVQIFCRSPEKARDLAKDFSAVTFSTYSERVLGEALVIAAPLADHEVVALAHPGLPVFDLRGEANRLLSHLPHAVTLDRIFGELEALRQEHLLRITSIQDQVSRRVRQQFLLPECRPLGWDDLCA